MCNVRFKTNMKNKIKFMRTGGDSLYETPNGNVIEVKITDLCWVIKWS